MTEEAVSGRTGLDFWIHAGEILHRMRSPFGGVLCTVIDRSGRDNVLTLGWGLIGPSYHGHPVFAIAVAPPRYSWRFLEEIPEFVIAVPDDARRAAADLCGTRSGRDIDKFHAAQLTRVPSRHVQPPSIAECPINVECRIYHRVAPPHELLTPEHRQSPVSEQHTIYFAEVLGTYRYG
jgi:flavin reductase (DIM6/NTAB) family NADH-FMN oxidoreductase RutF